MDPPLVGALSFVILFGLLAMGMNIAFAMILVAFVGFIVVSASRGRWVCGLRPPIV